MYSGMEGRVGGLVREEERRGRKGDAEVQRRGGMGEEGPRVGELV